ncbi:MAG: hypothetical protein ING06_19285 [Roseomonas sp.]|nr:hypothetical protein [Roseomonas sp.]
MRKFARLMDNTVMEIFLMDEESLKASYHPDIVATCRDLPMDHEVEVGWRLVADELVPPPPPPPPPPPTDVSFWQFMMAAWKLNFITHAEALAAVRQRIMPPAFADAIADLPAEAKLEAELKFAGITRMLRSDTMFALVVAANIATDEEIDGVFAVAATIA